ncbi:MAG TPA: PepSY-associated TM helix domain-containing protein [Solirubrobacteraceae bacterium]|jgi:uncharacterized iron-regulated membrane protein|nr:PepSY-associated TM helix domain-containing protein [Solirubrobacteraceae bacterium]
MRVLRVSHRWVSIVAGLLLLTITTSGSILLFEPEMRQLSHPSRFHVTPGAHPISPQTATSAAQHAYRRAGAPTRVVRNRGVFEVALGDTPETIVSVDPGNGHVLGATKPERGVLGFLSNLHECGLSCEGYPGYVAALNKPMPDLGIQGIDKITIGDFALGLIGVMLFGLVLSGIVLWWPGIRRWRRGFQVRSHKGRYARDYDLHKLIGIVALPFLAMWAITGMNFELPVVSKAVYGVMGADPGPDPTMKSVVAKEGTPDIGIDRAIAAARRLAGGGALTGANLPDAQDQTSTYLVWFAHGIDPVRNTDYAGMLGIGVDRHTGRAQALYGRLGRPLRQMLWSDWTTGAHYGMFVGWIARLLWLMFGIAPLLLAITGMSTWLYKRAKRRERKRRRRASVPAMPPL